MTDADLSHDLALELGCPVPPEINIPFKRKIVNVKFATADVREVQKQYGGHLVVDQNLINWLYEDYIQAWQNKKLKMALGHPDYPFMHFIYQIRSSVRQVSGMIIPGPVKFMVFLAVPKRIVLQPGKE